MHDAFQNNEQPYPQTAFAAALEGPAAQQTHNADCRPAAQSASEPCPDHAPGNPF